MFIWKPYKIFKQRVILIIQSRGDIIHKKTLGVYDAGRSSRQQRGENWNTIKNKENKTNTSMFISESKFLAFNLYNLFSLGLLIPCILFLPISTFFLATLSLPRVCFFSLCSKRFAPSLPQVSLSSPNFLVELAGKRSLRKLPFLPFLRSWRSFFACESFGDEPVIFSCLSKKRRGPG